MLVIGEFAGAEVGLRWEAEDGHRGLGRHQVIVLTWREAPNSRVQGLVDMLGGFASVQQWEDGGLRVKIVHDEELDWLLVDLIDLLVTIRYEHPTMVQLSLMLGEEAAAGLIAVLEGIDG